MCELRVHLWQISGKYCRAKYVLKILEPIDKSY